MIQFLEIHDDFEARAAFLRILPVFVKYGVKVLALEVGYDGKDVSQVIRRLEDEMIGFDRMQNMQGLPLYSELSKSKYPGVFKVVKSHKNWRSMVRPKHFKPIVERNIYAAFNCAYIIELIRVAKGLGLNINFFDSSKHSSKVFDKGIEMSGVKSFMNSSFHQERLSCIRKNTRELLEKGYSKDQVLFYTGLAHCHDFSGIVNVRQFTFTSNIEETKAWLSDIGPNSVSIIKSENASEELMSILFPPRGEYSCESLFMIRLLKVMTPEKYWLPLFEATQSNGNIKTRLGIILRRISTVKSQQDCDRLMSSVRYAYSSDDIESMMLAKPSIDALSAAERFAENNIVADSVSKKQPDYL
jgi:hypothetical protein